MLLTITLGVFIGLLMGVTGAGGGILAVPLLVFLLHLTVAEATPIGLLAVATAAGIGAIAGLRGGLVRYRAALLMAFAGVIFSPLGIWLAHRVANQYLLILFSVILLYVAYDTIRHQTKTAMESQSTPTCSLNSQTGRFVWNSRCSVSILLSGTIAGFLSGLVGVGGGFVIVPALQKLSSLSMQSVVATSLAVIALVSTTVVAGNLALGNLNWMIAAPFSLGAISGMVLGRTIAGKLNARYVGFSFATLAAVVALMLLVKVFS
ncbi:MAG: sulfite exporter TauE/SafE family protein [Methylophilaceae bacterium]